MFRNGSDVRSAGYLLAASLRQRRCPSKSGLKEASWRSARSRTPDARCQPDDRRPALIWRFPDEPHQPVGVILLSRATLLVLVEVRPRYLHERILVVEEVKAFGSTVEVLVNRAAGLELAHVIHRLPSRHFRRPFWGAPRRDAFRPVRFCA